MKFSQMPYNRLDMEELSAKTAALAAGVKDAESAEKALEMHKEFSTLYKNALTIRWMSYIRHTVNTEDEFFDKENDFFDENYPVLLMLAIDVYKEMLNSPFRNELEKALGVFWFKIIELKVKAVDERIIKELQQDYALCSKYQKLLASASFEFDGKTVNLPQLGAYMQSKDREVRKAAFAKRTEFFLEHEAELDDMFQELVRLRDGMAKTLGYKDFIGFGYVRMERNCYDAATVKIFRDQVKKVLVPFVTELHEQRRMSLGVEKLKFFDEEIYYPEGNPTPKGTPDEMFDAGKKMYSELSPETKVFFDFMLENELFDVLAKKGKAGGGYCAYLPDYGAPFVFANFNGTSDDVDVLTHECGHALCAYLASSIEPIEYQEYTYDVAEIHSMSMEFFTSKWMELFFGDDYKKYLYTHLASALAFIPYGCMVDEFQHIVYENPDMTPRERKDAWQKLESEYKPHLDYDGDPFFGKGGHWQRQSHIYERPFYYIDYCLAQTCALQYRLWMEEDREAAWASYIGLLNKAGTGTLTSLVTEAGLKSPFDPGCMESIIRGAAKILKQLK